MPYENRNGVLIWVEPKDAIQQTMNLQPSDSSTRIGRFRAAQSEADKRNEGIKYTTSNERPTRRTAPRTVVLMDKKSGEPKLHTKQVPIQLPGGAVPTTFLSVAMHLPFRALELEDNNLPKDGDALLDVTFAKFPIEKLIAYGTQYLPRQLTTAMPTWYKNWALNTVIKDSPNLIRLPRSETPTLVSKERKPKLFSSDDFNKYSDSETISYEDALDSYNNPWKKFDTFYFLKDGKNIDPSLKAKLGVKWFQPQSSYASDVLNYQSLPRLAAIIGDNNSMYSSAANRARNTRVNYVPREIIEYYEGIGTRGYTSRGTNNVVVDATDPKFAESHEVRHQLDYGLFNYFLGDVKAAYDIMDPYNYRSVLKGIDQLEIGTTINDARRQLLDEAGLSTATLKKQNEYLNSLPEKELWQAINNANEYGSDAIQGQISLYSRLLKCDLKRRGVFIEGDEPETILQAAKKYIEENPQEKYIKQKYEDIKNRAGSREEDSKQLRELLMHHPSVIPAAIGSYKFMNNATNTNTNTDQSQTR